MTLLSTLIMKFTAALTDPEIQYSTYKFVIFRRSRKTRPLGRRHTCWLRSSFNEAGRGLSLDIIMKFKNIADLAYKLAFIFGLIYSTTDYKP